MPLARSAWFAGAVSFTIALTSCAERPVASGARPGEAFRADVLGDARADLVIARTPETGVTYVFGPSWTGLIGPQAAQVVAPVGSHWPSAALCAGDLTGDGRDDLLFTFGRPTDPGYWIASGADTGPSALAAYTLQVPGATDVTNLGLRATALDFNGDGVPDLAAGGSRCLVVYGGRRTEGAVEFGQVLFHAVPAGDEMTVFGAYADRVEPAGDLDGDGCADLLLRHEPHGDDTKGLPIVEIVYGAKSREAVRRSAVPLPADLSGSGAVRRFGSGIAGDLRSRRKGPGSFVLTSPRATHGTSTEILGAAWLYSGGADGRTPTVVRRLLGPADSASQLGWHAANLGDVDGDGGDDLAITGYVVETDGESRRPEVHLFASRDLRDASSGQTPSPATPLVARTVLRLPRTTRNMSGENGMMPRAAACGDVTGARIADFVIGDPSFGGIDENSKTRIGAAYLVPGRKVWPSGPVELAQCVPQPPAGQGGQDPDLAFGAVLLRILRR